MKKIINNIEIEYEQESENFINELIEYLLSQTEKIYKFFEYIPKETIKIKIVKSIKELSKIYEEKVASQEMPKSVVGFCTLDHVANLLSYNEYKNTCHRYETLEDYKKTLVHEFVHAVHDLYCEGRYTGIRPVWEGVAVYLSEQYNCIDGSISVSKEELLSGNCNYREFGFFFEILLRTYSKKTTLEILKNNIDGEKILDEILAQNIIK